MQRTPCAATASRSAAASSGGSDLGAEASAEAKEGTCAGGAPLSPLSAT